MRVLEIMCEPDRKPRCWVGHAPSLAIRVYHDKDLHNWQIECFHVFGDAEVRRIGTVHGLTLKQAEIEAASLLRQHYAPTVDLLNMWEQEQVIAS